MTRAGPSTTASTASWSPTTAVARWTGRVATLDALPEVVERVGGRVPVVLDSGVRGGADAFKALALGATAVGIGRPYAYGLAVAGADGVREVVRNHIAELDVTMALAGHRSIAEIGRDSLRAA